MLIKHKNVSYHINIWKYVKGMQRLKKHEKLKFIVYYEWNRCFWTLNCSSINIDTYLLLLKDFCLIFDLISNLYFELICLEFAHWNGFEYILHTIYIDLLYIFQVSLMSLIHVPKCRLLSLWYHRGRKIFI